MGGVWGPTSLISKPCLRGTLCKIRLKNNLMWIWRFLSAGNTTIWIKCCTWQPYRFCVCNRYFVTPQAISWCPGLSGPCTLHSTVDTCTWKYNFCVNYKFIVMCTAYQMSPTQQTIWRNGTKYLLWFITNMSSFAIYNKICGCTH